MKKKIIIFVATLAFIFGTPIGIAQAAKTYTPKITEVQGTSYSTGKKYQVRSVRVHFQIPQVNNGQIIKVRYKLKGKKYTDVKYKPPKSSNQSGVVNAACSSTGSAINLTDIPDNNTSLDKRFLYDVKVQIKQPGKSWSNWSTVHSF